MSEMDLNGFVYGVCRPFTKNEESMQKFAIYLSKRTRWSLRSTWYG